MAVEALFDSIQHGSNLEPDTAHALAQHKVSVTPTLATRHFMNMHLEDPQIPEVIRSRARATAHSRSAAYKNALGAGVTVTAGTDSGTTFVPHGALATEIRLLHEGGLSRREALAAATWLAAAEVGLPEQIGTLTLGAYADLVVLERDPLEDLSALDGVALVIRSGAVV